MHAQALLMISTGTPLQNNARELFNLLQFLDRSFKAAALEEEHADLTEEKLRKLHDLIRPYFLRRTKAQVLTFLPPMAQIIIPISMTVLQKKLYKLILAKNPELLRTIFTTSRALKPTERGSLSNILMQLRKCLCHPFVYSREIEERSEIAAVSHRNLVEASSKLQLLELMLPKLQERGHRVLIFSQFLDMLVGALDGAQIHATTCICQLKLGIEHCRGLLGWAGVSISALGRHIEQFTEAKTHRRIQRS